MLVAQCIKVALELVDDVGDPLTSVDHLFSIAPMMEWTDRHCRVFHRQLSPKARLYTEMVTAQAVIHGNRDRLLGFDPAEHPVALQLGGSDPGLMAQAAGIGAQRGYDEINMNVGCPSDRVREGRFGACLFAEPDLVAACVAAMAQAVDVPVTVKTRIAIDKMEGDEPLDCFVDTVAAAGCRHFIIHARKAWLTGLSPKENRTIPPLDYDRVYRLKQRRPDLTIVLNGGIENLEIVDQALDRLDGVMLGRAAYQDPYVLAKIQSHLFGGELLDRAQVVDSMGAYAQRQVEKGTRLHSVVRHMHGLFQGQRGARAWRRHLAENSHLPDADSKVLVQAFAKVRDAQKQPEFRAA